MRIALTSAAVGLFSLAACSHRVVQCNRLVDAINEETPKLKQALVQGSGHEQTKEALEDYAQEADALIAKIMKLDLKDKKLAGLRDRYAKLAHDHAAAARKVAASFDDRKKATEAAGELNALAAPEKALVQQINAYCQGHES